MSEKNRLQQKISICFLTFAVLCEILINFSYERGVLALQHYVGPVVFAFVGMMMLTGYVKLNLDEVLALLFPLWYLTSRLLLRELYLDDSFYNFCSLCLIYAMAFPFARLVKDETKKRGICAAALLFSIAYGVAAWVGVYAALSRQEVVLPFFGTTFSMEAQRLCMSAHPNVTACIFFTALVLDVWLAVYLRKRWATFTAILMGLGLYLAIGLTDSRTVMLQVSCLSAAVAFFACQKLQISPKWLRVGVAAVASVVVLTATFASFSVAMEGLGHLTAGAVAETVTEVETVAGQEQESLSANRPILQDLGTLTGRTQHYRGVVKMVSEHPDILFRGTRVSDLSMVMHYIGGVNTHNAYLQVLVNMGFVGLLIAIWFTFRAFWVAVRVVFVHEKRSTFADKLLAVLPLLLLINAITESYVFTELTPYYNFIFFLTLGYAMAHERTLRA